MRKKLLLQSILPILIGLLGCFLPVARYIVDGAHYSSLVIDDYTGYGTVVLLLVFGMYISLKCWQLQQPNKLAGILLGIYLVGFVLFRLYNTFTLFNSVQTNNLAQKLQADATPGEGLLLLGISGIWLILRHAKPTNP